MTSAPSSLQYRASLDPFSGSKHKRETKVRKLAVTLRIEENVARLEITEKNAELMAVAEPYSDLDCVKPRPGYIKFSMSMQMVFEVTPNSKRQQEVVRSLCLEGVTQCHGERGGALSQNLERRSLCLHLIARFLVLDAIFEHDLACKHGASSSENTSMHSTKRSVT